MSVRCYLTCYVVQRFVPRCKNLLELHKCINIEILYDFILHHFNGVKLARTSQNFLLVVYQVAGFGEIHGGKMKASIVLKFSSNSRICHDEGFCQDSNQVKKFFKFQHSYLKSINLEPVKSNSLDVPLGKPIQVLDLDLLSRSIENR